MKLQIKKIYHRFLRLVKKGEENKSCNFQDSNNSERISKKESFNDGKKQN